MFTDVEDASSGSPHDLDDIWTVIDYWFDLTWLWVLHQHSRQIMNMVVWVGGRIITIIIITVMMIMMMKGWGERVWYSFYISMIFMSFLCASSCSFSFTLLLHNVVCDKYRCYADVMTRLLNQHNYVQTAVHNPTMHLTNSKKPPLIWPHTLMWSYVVLHHYCHWLCCLTTSSLPNDCSSFSLSV